jgi:hypothetical protein
MLSTYATRALFKQNAVPSSRTIISSILHGSQTAKDEASQQHSKLVARGKYIHAFEVHKVKPDSTEEYKKAAGEYYSSIASDPRLNVKLTGSWETLIGEQDTFVHILEYENYKGYDRSVALMREASCKEALKAMLPHITSRSTQLNQEFKSFPSEPPRTQGGIFELRSYTLKPGALLEWEHTWRQGIEARKKLLSPVGAWFSQIGELHQVHHMWQYPDLATRKETRETAWQIDGWSDTVAKTALLTKSMTTSIINPMPWSPLK